MFKKLRRTARTLRSKVTETVMSNSSLRAKMCARYGYGYTLKGDDRTYFFHLPDIESDEDQARLLAEGHLQNAEQLRRLRRRSHPGLNILAVGCRFGGMALFFAKSMRAHKVHGLCHTAHIGELVRKNAVLNDVEAIVKTYPWRTTTLGEKHIPSGPVDSFCRKYKVRDVDLISLNAQGFELATLEGARDLLAACGPAIIMWAHPRQIEHSRPDIQTFLAGLGYDEPESWGNGVFYWVPRI